MSDTLELMKAMSSLYRKKAAVMKALEGGIVKGGTNKHFDYKFMEASTIKHTVGALFAEHGLSLQMSGVATENAVSHVEVKDYKTQEIRIKQVPVLRVQFSIALCDVDTGAREESFWFGEAGATDDKAANKAATAALKYYLISNLMIADKTEDKQDVDRGARKRDDKPTPTNRGDAPPSHWSDDQKIMTAMYKWAMDTHNASATDVNHIVKYADKRLNELSKDDVKALVAAWAARKDTAR